MHKRDILLVQGWLAAGHVGIYSVSRRAARHLNAIPLIDFSGHQQASSIEALQGSPSISQVAISGVFMQMLYYLRAPRAPSLFRVGVPIFTGLCPL